MCFNNSRIQGEDLSPVKRTQSPGPTGLALTATKKIDNQREVAEVAERFYKGSNKVAARSAIGSRTKSESASLLSMHKRPAATDFDRQLVAKVF